MRRCSRCSELCIAPVLGLAWWWARPSAHGSGRGWARLSAQLSAHGSERGWARLSMHGSVHGWARLSVHGSVHGSGRGWARLSAHRSGRGYLKCRRHRRHRHAMRTFPAMGPQRGRTSPRRTKSLGMGVEPALGSGRRWARPSTRRRSARPSLSYSCSCTKLSRVGLEGRQTKYTQA